jgi:hypothetical protein
LTALVFCVSLALDLRAGKFRRPFWPSGSRTFAVILGIWLAICVLSLIDLQIGHRLYSPTSVFDYSVRTAFVHSISTTGVPPQNPFFSPGHPVPLRYHYFWLMMCSLVNQIGGQGVSARQAIIGGTFWIGVGLIALLALLHGPSRAPPPPPPDRHRIAGYHRPRSSPFAFLLVPLRPRPGAILPTRRGTLE